LLPKDRASLGGKRRVVATGKSRADFSQSGQLHSSLAGGNSWQGGIETGGALLPTVTDPVP
jgi:hypothetical protein